MCKIPTNISIFQKMHFTTDSFYQKKFHYILKFDKAINTNRTNFFRS